MVNKGCEIVMADRQVTERYSQCSREFTGKSSYHSYRRSCDKKALSPFGTARLLTVDQKHTRQTSSHANLNLLEADH